MIVPETLEPNEPAHSSARNSLAPDDPKELDPAPAGTVGCVLTVSSPPVRVTLDGSDPEEFGITLREGSHYYPIGAGKLIRFVAADSGPARLGVLWLRQRQH